MHLIAHSTLAPPGPDIARIAAAIRGGASGFLRVRNLRSRATAEPVVVGVCEAMHAVPLRDRLRQLAAAASAPCREALRRHGGRLAAVLLALPSERPGLDPETLTALAGDIVRDLDVPLDGVTTAMVPGAQATGLRLVADAMKLIADDDAVVLVGGVDCFVDRHVLAWLEAMNRLKTSVAPKGLMPAEGAAFLLFGGRGSGVRVAGMGVAKEPKPWFGGESSIGAGLTAAIAACAGAAPERVAATFCDNNGETWRAHEWMYAYLRTAAVHPEPLDLREPAAGWGDLGAATGPALVSLAAHEMGRDPLLARTLVFAASDLTAERAAIILSRQDKTP
ncbi:hypothetical protein [Consotaella aegiceratis]|uniref:hypothetical protein n=1 Tax=Consotaella aegiceratis TaxID=3097961 RepID=UPI002F3F9F80